MGDVAPGITVRRDRLPAFLRSVAADRERAPGAPSGLCLLSGGIVARNLEYRLAADGVAGDVAATTTIEDLAAELVAADGRPARVLSPPVRERSIADVLDRAADRDTPLGRFARRVPAESGDVLAGVAAELDEYHRCTDAGRDREALSAVVDAVADDHPFAAETTRESVAAFAALDRRLGTLVEERNDAAPDRAFLSRSHLVRSARSAVDDRWHDAAGDPDWVALSTVSALDDPTLRFLLRIAREVPLLVFAGPGTADPFYRRLSAAADAVEVRHADRDAGSEDPAGTVLSAAVGDERTPAPAGVETVAVPDPRREVEYAVRAAARTEGSTLLVAPDAGDYGTALRDVALTRDHPFRVETRRELRDLPAFRGLAATVRLLAAADAGAVGTRDVVEPLRLGACPPAVLDDDGAGTWPAPADAVDAVRSALDGPDRTIAAVRSAVEAADGPLSGVGAFVEWVDARRRAPPRDGAALGELYGTLSDAYVAAVRDESVRELGGIAVDTGRARATAKHPAYFGREVRSAADSAARAYDWHLDALERSPSWETALAAVRQGAGSETYGLPRDDADAVEVVDAGNAHFRRVDRAFVLGLAAERFPRTPRRASFLHPAVRAAVHRRREAFPHLYLDGHAAQYERDLDAYAAALGVARGGVTLVRPYKDDEGRDVPPSPFLDALSVPDERHRRVGLDEWTAVGAGDGRVDHARTWGSLCEKERLRVLARDADRPGGPDADTLRRLAEGATDPDTAARIRRRLDAFERRLEGEDD
jgi:hypothetical protein